MGHLFASRRAYCGRALYLGATLYSGSHSLFRSHSLHRNGHSAAYRRERGTDALKEPGTRVWPLSSPNAHAQFAAAGWWPSVEWARVSFSRLESNRKPQAIVLVVCVHQHSTFLFNSLSALYTRTTNQTTSSLDRAVLTSRSEPV